VRIYLDTCCLNRPFDEQINEKIILEKGLEILTRELGASATIRFLRQFENGYGDYTEEREAMLKDVSIDDITTSITKRKNRLTQ
jgi:hypothetical protein